MFRIVTSALVAAACALAAGAAAQSAGPALLLSAVAATEAAKADYAFDFALDTSRQTWRARFDPGRSPRLRLIEPRRDELSGDERRAFDRIAAEMEGVSWCASENIARVSDLALVRESETEAVYAFQPTAESIRGEQARRFAERLRGEMTLIKTQPDIARVRLYAPQAFNPMPLVRVDAISVVITCQTAPNGRRYAAETVTDVRGSALGQAFNERSVQRARNLRAP